MWLIAPRRERQVLSRFVSLDFQLEYDSSSVSSAIFGRAVQVPASVLNQTSYRRCSVTTRSEAIQNGFVTFCVDFEYCSPIGPAATISGAIKVTGRVPNQSGRGIFPISATPEAVQHGFLAGAIDLEHGSTAGSTPQCRRAVEIAY